MTKFLILFVGTQNPGSYINVMAYALDKKNTEHIIFIDLVHSPIDLHDDFDAFINGELSNTLLDLAQGEYNQQALQLQRGFEVYKNVKHVFTKFKSTYEVKYESLIEDFERMKKTFNSIDEETIVDITGLPKRIAMDVLLACLQVNLTNVGVFELKKQGLRGINALYHMLQEKVDYEYAYAKDSKKLSITDNPDRRKQVDLQSTYDFYSFFAGLSLSINLILIFEFIIYHVPWTWLVSNPNSYSLQVAFDALMTSFAFGFFKPNWRKWCWGAGAFAIGLVLLQILGGPR